MNKIKILLFTYLTALVAFYGAAHAGGSFEQLKESSKVQIGVYGGYNTSFDSDVSVREDVGNVDLDDVSWDGDSFGDAPYWGARITYWPASLPNWGFMIDYSHAKIKAEDVGSLFNKLEFTDGLNLLLFNAVYKFDYSDRLKPYAGAGIGFAFPYVEVEQNVPNAPTTLEYQVTGVAAQILAGLEWKIDDRFALFTEYKLSYADIDADLSEGGSVETEALTNHFIFGLSYKFGMDDVIETLK